MKVRLAYHDSTLAICRRHHEDPPAWCPPLGPVLDSRDTMGCVVCLELKVRERAARSRQ